MLNYILEWLKNIWESYDCEPGNLDFSLAYEQKYSLLQIETKYERLSELQNILNLLIKCITNNILFNVKLLKTENNLIYLTDFLYDKYRGIVDYSADVNYLIETIIEFELILDELSETDTINGVLGYNYRIAQSISKDVYSIYTQLTELSRSIKCPQNTMSELSYISYLRKYLKI